MRYKKLILLLVIPILASCIDQDSAEEDPQFSEWEFNIAERECKRFLLERVNMNHTGEAKIFNKYIKSNKIVSEVGYRENAQHSISSNEAYRVRLCIYDPEAQTLMIPSVFDQDSWRE